MTRRHVALAAWMAMSLHSWTAGAQQGLPWLESQENSVKRVSEDREPKVTFADHALTLDGVLGFGAPVGIIGLTAMANPASALSVGAGVGGNSQGVQLAALTRVRPIIEEFRTRTLAFSTGLALATGPYRPQEPDPLLGLGKSMGHRSPDDTKRFAAFERVYWLQPDIGFERQAGSGFRFLAALGAALPLGFSGKHCVNEQGNRTDCDNGFLSGADKPKALLTLTLAMGVAIP